MTYLEKWQKDLAVYQDINKTFIIDGNIHDLQPWLYENEDVCEPFSLSMYLYKYLNEIGYRTIVYYNRIDGFYNPNAKDSHMLKDFFRCVSSDEKSSKSISTATELIRTAMGNTTSATAVVFDLANTITSTPDSLSDDEIEYFAKLMLASKNTTSAPSRKNTPISNLLILVVEKINDIPAWYYLNNPYVRQLTINKPDKDVREAVIKSYIHNLNGAEEASNEELNSAKNDFIALSDGMTLVEIYGVFSLCDNMSFTIYQIKDAIKMFRYGQTESHWDNLEMDTIRNAPEILGKRVKGQTAAVDKVTSVLSRASLGMSGIQGGSNSRPKGVLFFAGPTGTGKTELAKAIAEMIFGDESFVTRFDMSEYQQAHSDQKLLGAPPGYIGYSNGGQLTNAVKTKPFCVLLFDEIDKAHPTIMDKFLQILEDGRITDSAGETVYFSEALIIFTSNLGVVDEDEFGKRYQTINANMSYNDIQEKLLSVIKDYFKYTIKRPELLNRIGDNFVVFDFIRENVAFDILELKLKSVTDNLLREKGLEIIISDSFKTYLNKTIDLSNGGRGISNMVETLLVNPLADVLIREGKRKISKLSIDLNPDNSQLCYSVIE